MDYRAYGRPLASIAVFVFLMVANRPWEDLLPQAGLNIAVWASFAFILFIPKAWWTRARIAIACSLLAIECVIDIVWFHEMKLLYFCAILLLAVVIRMSFSKITASALILMILTTVLYIRFGRYDVFSLLSFVTMASVLYLFIRSRIQRNEIHEMNKRHLAELQDAYEQLHTASATTIQNVVLEERTRIARDIHDAVGHSLTSLIVQMQALRYMMKENPDEARQSLEGMLAVARQGLQDIRSSVHALADNRTVPGITVLKSLLSRMEASASIRFSLQMDVNDEEVTVETFETLFRVLQEAITNVIRHSQATMLKVTIDKETETVTMRIRDNGILQADREINEGYGLLTMKTRLAEKGGSLLYRITEPNGFEIIATIPNGDPSQHHDTEKED
ncbi:sensor histidine kinase [Paenibacillus sp. FSL H8-0034]|uniref:sensor histidine kinase n=1 Tax=Paenibacillus sp. FSL H8-0034 TaxID=2954671 RepID=UPI0030FC8A15